MEDFWAKVIGTYLTELTGDAAEKVSKTLADLWRKRGAPPSPAQAELPAPFNSPPPLPLSETPLFGREAEFVEILKLLRDFRLVTLTGPGGVGKTALAQTVARWFWQRISKMAVESRIELHSDKQSGQAATVPALLKYVEDTEHETQANPRGVVYIPLDALSTGSELGEYLRLRVVPNSQPPATDNAALRRENELRVIGAALQRHALLVVLDNFESVMDGGKGEAEALPFLAELVSIAGGEVRFLATSQRALDPAADIEKTYEINPLARKGAIDLFYARAGQELRRNAASNEDVSQICRLVDDLPLAVELAASAYKTGHRPLAEIREGLRVTPLDVEATRMLQYPERQRGLVASFRYTFNHLGIAPQRLFMLMHIFRGSADRQAIKYVDGSVNWDRALSELVNWHLVDQHRARDPWRYSMLATTEAFSRFQFTTNPTQPRLDENEFRKRHAEYYVRVAARMHELPMQRWSEIEETDWENIKAGADWAVQELEAREGATVEQLLARLDDLPEDSTEAGLAGEYAENLFAFIYRRRKHEGEKWLGAGLIAFHLSGNRKREGWMCSELATWYQLRGSYDKALEWYERSVKLSKGLDDAVLATTYNNIGEIYRARGAYDEALKSYLDSIKLFETLEDAAGLAATYNNIGEIYRARGAYDDALEQYERSIKIKIGRDDAAGLATTYNNIGELYRARGAYDDALEWYERSIEIKKKLGDAAGLATTYNNIGATHRARAQYDKALEWYGRSIELFELLGDVAGLATTLHNMGFVAIVNRDLQNALSLFTRSREIYARIGLEKDVQEEDKIIEQLKPLINLKT